MIGFRVDANEQVATGHLMRCIAIAEACKKQGEECLFLLAEEKVIKPLQEHDMPFRVLHSKWNELESELDILKVVLKEEKITYLVVDSYRVTDFYLKQLNEQVPVLYIDDEGEGIYPVSAVLHYSEWQEEYEYQEKYLDTKTVVLSGMQYVPLRQEFSLEVDKKVRENSILITTGGTDPFNICGMLLDCLIKQEEFKKYSFQVIVGSMNQYEDKLQQMAGKDARIILHKNVKNMEEFMRKCKLAVSAGGTTLFELCASGIPTVCFSFADNQQRFTEELAQHKIMIYAGDARKRENIAEDIVNGLLCYNKNSQMYFSYAKRMKDLVDGNGASKVASFLCKKESKIQNLKLRKAELSDAKLLYEWKNDQECVRNSLTGKPVVWEEHQAWFASVQQRNDVVIFILEADDILLGQIRLNIKEEYGVISYSIAKEYRGRQLGREILIRVEEKAKQLELKGLRAEVQRYNLPSRKLFLQLGYEEVLKENNLWYEKSIPDSKESRIGVMR